MVILAIIATGNRNNRNTRSGSRRSSSSSSSVSCRNNGNTRDNGNIIEGRVVTARGKEGVEETATAIVRVLLIVIVQVSVQE